MAWSTTLEIDVHVGGDVVVEHHVVSTVERQARALSTLVAAQPQRQSVARLARTLQYFEPALVLVAAVVWVHVLSVTAHALT